MEERVRGFVAVTDLDWYGFLRREPDLDEVNFWRPSDTRTPQQLIPGMPLLFKLRKRHGGRIVGFGLFARHKVMPAWLAWDTFERRNGTASFSEMRTRIERLRSDYDDVRATQGDYPIGCLMLSSPVFFEPDEGVSPPSDYPDNAVQGKTYDLREGEGARIWAECLARAAAAPRMHGADVHQLELPRYGTPVLVRPRLGQGTFRVAVTDAYGMSCAVTSEHSLPVLEAAHIRPYSEGGLHEVRNGLLLRSDIHRLFDKGYVGVTPALRFVVSPRLRDDYSNGRSYYPLEGQQIQVPQTPEEQPDPELLEWHYETRFRKSG